MGMGKQFGPQSEMPKQTGIVRRFLPSSHPHGPLRSTHFTNSTTPMIDESDKSVMGPSGRKKTGRKTHPVEKLLWSISETARVFGFSRFVIAEMCRKGELPFIPCRDRKGKVSKIHKKIPVAAAKEWIAKNQVFGSGQLLQAVDGRRSI